MPLLKRGSNFSLHILFFIDEIYYSVSVYISISFIKLSIYKVLYNHILILSIGLYLTQPIHSQVLYFNSSLHYHKAFAISSHKGNLPWVCLCLWKLSVALKFWPHFGIIFVPLSFSIKCCCGKDWVQSVGIFFLCLSIDLWFLKYSPGISSISITWEFVMMQILRPHFTATKLEMLGIESSNILTNQFRVSHTHWSSITG